MSHSKRNTSRPVFTAHERSLAQSHWNASKARLNRESFLPFGSCNLCLEISRDPVCCPRGDVFCRECALANIIAQKKELKRAERGREEAENEAARRITLEEEEDRARSIRDFELTQAGLPTTKPGSRPRPAAVEAEGNGKTPADEATRQPKLLTSGEPSDGTVTISDKDGETKKRKFILDEDEVDRGTKEARAKARKAIDDEKAAKPTLPSFWTPTLTPDVHESKIGPAAEKHKTTPVCPASSEDNQHPITLKKLITIKFDEQKSEATDETQRLCPSCRKVLSNATAPVLARHCGHVLCKNCVTQFLIPPSKKSGSEKDSIITCFVCDEPVAVHSAPEDGQRPGLPTGLVALKSEGTGFAARGDNTVKKSGVSFQC